MSVKIYYGIRIPISKIKDFIDYFDNSCLNYLKTQTLNLMSSIEQDLVIERANKMIGIRGNKSEEEFLENGGEEYIRYYEVAKIYFEEMIRRYNFINPECWFNAFPDNKYFYIVPGFPSGFKIKNNVYPNYVEDYCYWNNADEPNHITYEEFENRGKQWDAVGALDVCVRNKLSHILIGYDPVYIDGMIRLEKMVLAHPSNKRRPLASYAALYDVKDGK